MLKQGKYKSKDPKGPEIIVRMATNRDVPKMLQNYSAVIREGVYLGAEKLLTRHRKGYLAHIKDSRSLTIVALVQGKIVGGLNMWPSGLHKMRHLREINMLVISSHREIGVGSALMDYSLRWARRRKDIEKIVLGVFSSNKRAYHLYERYGFKVEGVLKHQHILKGRYVDEIRMAIFV